MNFMQKPNPKLNYRIDKEITNKFKEACENQAISPGKLIRKWMIEFIEKSKKF